MPHVSEISNHCEISSQTHFEVDAGVTRRRWQRAFARLRKSSWRAAFRGFHDAVLEKCLAVASPLLVLSATAAAADPTTAADTSLTYRGVTLYGVVDLGVQYQTHGAAISDYFSGGSGEIIQRYSNHSVVGVTPSNLSQSKIGLSITEPLQEKWSAIVKLETYFNPQSGELVDALKSLTLNNGKPLSQQSTNLDSSMAGQVFQQSYGGFQSQRYGTLTFGRQNSILADGISAHDPNTGAQAFSLLGLSGTAAGGGDTEDRRLDSALKYRISIHDLFRVGGLYRFRNGNQATDSVAEGTVGVSLGGLAVDGYYARVTNGVAHSTLTAAQVSALPSYGLSVSDSVAGTVSDNTSYSVMSSYHFRRVELDAGYERIRYTDPSDALKIGDEAIGGYMLGAVDNTAFPQAKRLNVYWAGAKFEVRRAQLVLAYYGYRQNSYGAGVDGSCASNVAKTCSGALDDFSLNASYRLTHRFTAYTGAMYSQVRGGLSSGYLHTADLTTTTGMRFTF
jgi:predicted porin